METRNLLDKLIVTGAIISTISLGYNACDLFKFCDKEYQYFKTYGYDREGKVIKNSERNIFSAEKESDLLVRSICGLTALCFCYGYFKKNSQ